MYCYKQHWAPREMAQRGIWGKCSVRILYCVPPTRHNSQSYFRTLYQKPRYQFSAIEYEVTIEAMINWKLNSFFKHSVDIPGAKSHDNSSEVSITSSCRCPVSSDMISSEMVTLYVIGDRKFNLITIQVMSSELFLTSHNYRTRPDLVILYSNLLPEYWHEI